MLEFQALFCYYIAVNKRKTTKEQPKLTWEFSESRKGGFSQLWHGRTSIKQQNILEPSKEALKLLSKLFNVTINTLLGSPQQLICQCCGMPLGDDTTSKDPDGNFNEDYCKWCYADGEFKYSSKKQLIDFCVEHMATEEWPAEQVRAHMESVVPGLKHWNCSTNAF